MSATRNKILGGVVFVVCMCALQSISEVLEFNREQVLSGEFWRILTGHLVHTNMAHFALNTVAALIVYFAFFSSVKLGDLLAYGTVFAVLISVGLLYIYPGLDWYNGLSGLLHALVAYFSIRLIRNGDRVFWVGLTVVWMKILAETIHTELGYGGLIGEMPVITEAHLIGAFMGTITGIIWDGILARNRDRGRSAVAPIKRVSTLEVDLEYK